MTRAGKAIGVMLLVILAGCTVRPAVDGPRRPRLPARATAATLQGFDSCDPLLDELRELGEGQVGSVSGERDGFGIDMPTARSSDDAGAGPGDAAEFATPTTMAGGTDEQAATSGEWGGTNVQEAGVDEPDTIKTNGTTVIAVTAGRLRIVDVATDTPQTLGELPVPAGAQILVDDTTVLVLASDREGPATELTAIDIAVPTRPVVVEQVRLDGQLTSARMVDGMVRVVTTTGGPNVAFDMPSATRAAETARRNNLDAVRRSQIEDWLPRVRTVTTDGRLIEDEPAVACDRVFVPEEPTNTNMVNVLSLDLRTDGLEPVGGASVVGVGETVYASAERLYVTSTGWDPGVTSGSLTDVHQFAIGGREPASYLASGRVRGWLLNQFSLSEHAGDLRIAVTDAGTASTESSVVVLRDSGGELVEVGRVDGLGRGEQIYSVRFIGEVGYVVTFRQTDPLYTIDLSDPAAPRMVGELKIPGYSSYLHPAGDGRLIGIGQDATLQGLTTGLQLALFDVSDLASPRQLHKVVLPGANSTAEDDHHAFLWWAEAGLAVVPVNDWTGPPGFQGAVGFSVSDGGIDERGRLAHGAGVPIERIVVIGDRLVSVSASGLGVSDPQTFSEQAFLQFD